MQSNILFRQFTTSSCFASMLLFYSIPFDVFASDILSCSLFSFCSLDFLGHALWIHKTDWRQLYLGTKVAFRDFDNISNNKTCENVYLTFAHLLKWIRYVAFVNNTKLLITLFGQVDRISPPKWKYNRYLILILCYLLQHSMWSSSHFSTITWHKKNVAPKKEKEKKTK